MRKIYSFRPLSLTKACRWITYHPTVHTTVMHIKKTNKIMTMCLNERERERENLRERESQRERESLRERERESESLKQ